MTNNIRDLRKNQRLTQAQLAATVNIDQSQVSRWERGMSKPSRKYHSILAQTLGVDATELGLEREGH